MPALVVGMWIVPAWRFQHGHASVDMAPGRRYQLPDDAAGRGSLEAFKGAFYLLEKK